jgi:hypothetical protein
MPSPNSMPVPHWPQPGKGQQECGATRFQASASSAHLFSPCSYPAHKPIGLDSPRGSWAFGGPGCPVQDRPTRVSITRQSSSDLPSLCEVEMRTWAGGCRLSGCGTLPTSSSGPGRHLGSCFSSSFPHPPGPGLSGESPEHFIRESTGAGDQLRVFWAANIQDGNAVFAQSTNSSTFETLPCFCCTPLQRTIQRAVEKTASNHRALLTMGTGPSRHYSYSFMNTELTYTFCNSQLISGMIQDSYILLIQKHLPKK